MSFRSFNNINFPVETFIEFIVKNSINLHVRIPEKKEHNFVCREYKEIRIQIQREPGCIFTVVNKEKYMQMYMRS